MKTTLLNPVKCMRSIAQAFAWAGKETMRSFSGFAKHESTSSIYPQGSGNFADCEISNEVSPINQYQFNFSNKKTKRGIRGRIPKIRLRRSKASFELAKSSVPKKPELFCLWGSQNADTKITK